jgi:uncharacterized protein (DUF58 family)
VSDRLELFLPPQRRRTHVLRLVREVLDRPAEGGTDLESGLEAVLSTLKRRAVLFLISDFLGSPCTKAIRAAAARHDLIVVEVVDPRDQEIPDTGPVVIRDAETGEIGIAGGRREARRYLESRRQERDALQRATRRAGVDHVVLRTDRPYLQTLLAFFEQRRKRMRR